MARSVDSAAQRRRVLGEIARLAEIAMFGTLPRKRNQRNSPSKRPTDRGKSRSGTEQRPTYSYRLAKSLATSPPRKLVGLGTVNTWM